MPSNSSTSLRDMKYTVKFSFLSYGELLSPKSVKALLKKVLSPLVTVILPVTPFLMVAPQKALPYSDSENSSSSFTQKLTSSSSSSPSPSSPSSDSKLASSTGESMESPSSLTVRLSDATSSDALTAPIVKTANNRNVTSIIFLNFIFFNSKYKCHIQLNTLLIYINKSI